MNTGSRSILITMMSLSLLAAAIMLFNPQWLWLAWIIIASSLISVTLILRLDRTDEELESSEPESIDRLADERRRELVRGTSFHLSNMKYRYSVRIDPSDIGDRRCFSADVNAIKLGFIPVLMTDTKMNREGAGFLAFVHDGDRWRGPGLPCPADQADAVRHAAKCVAPLSSDDETHF